MHLLFISFSLALALGITVAVLIKWVGLKLWQAAVCIAFGFCLASTDAAPYIRRILAAIVRLVSGH